MFQIKSLLIFLDMGQVGREGRQSETWDRGASGVPRGPLVPVSTLPTPSRTGGTLIGSARCLSVPSPLIYVQRFRRLLASASTFSYVLHRNRIFLNTRALRSGRGKHALCGFWLRCRRLPSCCCISIQAPPTWVARPLPEAVAEGFTPA